MRRLNRRDGDDGRTLIARLNLQLATVLAKPLAHTGDTHTERIRLTLTLCRMGSNAPSKVADLEDHFRHPSFQPNDSLIAAGMADNIGKRLLNDQVKIPFQRDRQPLRRDWKLQLDREAAP